MISCPPLHHTHPHSFPTRRSSDLLYVILTGKSPFNGKTTAEVLVLVRRGAYEPAAVVSAECPKPLTTAAGSYAPRSEEHTSELQSHSDLVCRLLLEKKKKTKS